MLPFFYRNPPPQPQTVPAVSNTITDISTFSGTISDTELCKAISGNEVLLADTVLKQAYNRLYSIKKVMCGSNDPVSLRCLYLYLYVLDNFIVQCYTGTKTFTFEVPMIIYKSDPSNMYKDTCVPNDVVFHANGVGSDIHYFNGIYQSNQSYWPNTNIGDMFRTTFNASDVGVNGYSNNGIGELGGNNAVTQAAFDSWLAKLITFTTTQLAEQGVSIISCTGTLKEQITTATSITNKVYLSITLDSSGPNLTTMMMNANVDNEWDKVAGASLDGWEFKDILLTDTTTHRYEATVTTESIPSQTESYITEAQLLSILSNIEQISKSCCS